MPNIKSAKKKMRQDRKRTQANDLIRKRITKGVKSVLKNKGKEPKLVSKLFSIIDKATKKKIIHKNKAARLKARVSKTLPKKK